MFFVFVLLLVSFVVVVVAALAGCGVEGGVAGICGAVAVLLSVAFARSWLQHDFAGLGVCCLCFVWLGGGG